MLRSGLLETRIRGLVLTPLTERHALALYELIQENLRHLVAYGDYSDLIAMPFERLAADLSEPSNPNLRFGIFMQERLIGCIDLVPVAPPRYGVGYWLAESATGKGYATAALQTVLGLAATELQATDVFAGVTHGNSRSAAVLERAGFVPVQTFQRYTRFHRSLN